MNYPPFFESIARLDSRLKYVAIKRPVGEDLTVGAKRNATILLASGQYNGHEHALNKVPWHHCYTYLGYMLYAR